MCFIELFVVLGGPSREVLVAVAPTTESLHIHRGPGRIFFLPK